MMITLRRTLYVAVAFLALAGAQTPASADSWPVRPVKLLTPFPPGSGGDITGRYLADALAKRWGKPVVVENRPGADGIIAVSALLASSDDHTLLYTNGGPLTSNLISHAGKLPYEADRDLLPISAGAEVFVAIGVPTTLPVKSIADFVNLARARPGELNWAGTPGSLDYLLPGFFRTFGLDVVQLRYRDIASAMQDLSQSRLHFYAAGVATQLPMVQAGSIKIVAVTNKVRAPAVPDIPTVEEGGFSELRYEAFLGFFGPRGMTRAVQDKISEDIRAVGSNPELGEKFNAVGMKVRVTTPNELATIVADERAALSRMTGKSSQAPAR
jgi:tripartite-type tricarboxylate transporter receptor subunit TctC